MSLSQDWNSRLSDPKYWEHCGEEGSLGILFLTARRQEICLGCPQFQLGRDAEVMLSKVSQRKLRPPVNKFAPGGKAKVPPLLSHPQDVISLPLPCWGEDQIPIARQPGL